MVSDFNGDSRRVQEIFTNLNTGTKLTVLLTKVIGQVGESVNENTSS